MQPPTKDLKSLLNAAEPPSRSSVSYILPQKAEDEEEDEEEDTGASAFQAHVAQLSAQRQPHFKENNLERQTIMTPFGDTVITTPPGSTNPPQTLHHMQYHWPGTTGGGKHHLDIRPLLYHDILSSKYPIVIPLFQRRYCWSNSQIQQWYIDVATPVAGQHRTHKTMFKKQKQPSGEEVLLCIDGQQRMTTATLMLAALRVQCRKHQMIKLVDKIDAIILKGRTSLQAMQNWAEEQAHEWIEQQHDNTMNEFPSGWLPSIFQTTIVPSYADRAAYFEIICKDYVEEALEKLQQQPTTLGFSSGCQTSIQYTAFCHFSQQISIAVASAHNHDAKISSFLSRLFQKQLYGFTFMYIELLTDDNLQQVFLWMQEKSVFGMGRLLLNPSPGVDFSPMDLARNLVVSSVMNEPLSTQVEFYQTCWLTPLEVRFGSPNMYGETNPNLERILAHLVERVCQEAEEEEKKNPRYIGDMEQQLEQYKIMVPPALQKNFQLDTPMMVYARFHSYVQARAIAIEGTPSAITRAVADSIVQELVQEGEKMGL